MTATVPRLDRTTITSLAAPTGWTGTTRAVFAARYLHTLVGIRRLAALLAERAPGTLAESGLQTSLEAIGAAPAGTQKRVLNHPSVAFWVDVAWNLVGRRAPERFPEVHLLPHLREFARFALSALLLHGHGRLTADVRADAAGRISLPGSGLALEGVAPWARTSLTVDNGRLTWSGQQLRVPRLAGGMELNWLDRDLRLGGRARFTYAELDPVEGQRWHDELNRHVDLIGAVCAPLAEELVGGLGVIVPVLSPDPSRVHVSGSFHEAPGLVALALGERMATAEALVHEYGHQKLNAVLPLDPLIADDSGEAVHYSPWRDDPRPLSGLLHAVYSFVSVADFYRAVLDTPDAGGLAPQSVVNRAYRVVRQVRDGLDELRAAAALTSLGAAFVDAVTDRIEACDRALPPPPPGERRSVDAERTAHRARWDERHSAPAARAAPGPASVVRPARGDAVTVATLHALGLPDDWDPGAIVRRWYPADSLLEAVRDLHQLRGGTAADVLPDTVPGEGLIPDLAAAHLAYVSEDYRTARVRYAACVNHDPQSPYFWQCYAFALRRLGRRDEALYILTHTEALMARRSPLSADQDMRTTAEALAWGLRLPERTDAGPASVRPVHLPVTEAVERELRASRYWDLAEATRGGAQLPTLIAVANGLKPAMDLWVPRDGWPALRALTETLGLVHHVDACFDRLSPQIAQVPPDRLTTTRAAFVPDLRQGAEAHVFLARDQAALDRVVGSGWYPLIVDGKVVDKHRADHDTFGEALGYPACCQDFFRQRNNWNDDNTYYAALCNTQGRPNPLCNPHLRHTLYGLVPYMPCSYSCSATMKFADRLHEVIRIELPSYAKAIERAIAKPLLCVSELRMYGFEGETVHQNDGTVTITYSGAKSLYPIEDTDPLWDLLRAGDRCTVDGNIIHVGRADAYIAGYEARGDHHGPECPFVISFS
ncbi:HEXXH motif-containing putative peptide modification protein [Streptomyces sp. NPDC056835]|uniref:aKG-HExxH-type peptide beta-hydroxylase n=1 Tax=Streptomyces sp. NPDC056835 TaxID=3345956 RepID=UPI00368ED377